MVLVVLVMVVLLGGARCSVVLLALPLLACCAVPGCCGARERGACVPWLRRVIYIFFIKKKERFQTTSNTSNSGL